MSDSKVVIVLRSGLSAPIAANTSALLALSLGARHPELIGPSVRDGSGKSHSGISTLGVPVLAGDAETVARLASSESVDVDTVSFTETAARARSYAGYTEEMAGTASEELEYLGVGLMGPVKEIKSLTGSLPLLR